MAKQGRKGRPRRTRKSLTGAAAVSARTRAATHRKQTLAGLVTLTGRLFARALHHRLVPHGVAPGQLAVLERLWEGEGLTQAELARTVQVEQPTMARTLDRMARDGLIQRVPSREDRRAFNVRLTSRGRGLRRAVASEARRLNAFALSAVGKRERVQLTRLLGEVARTLGKEISGEDA